MALWDGRLGVEWVCVCVGEGRGGGGSLSTDIIPIRISAPGFLSTLNLYEVFQVELNLMLRLGQIFHICDQGRFHPMLVESSPLWGSPRCQSALPNRALRHRNASPLQDQAPPALLGLPQLPSEAGLPLGPLRAHDRLFWKRTRGS